MIRNLVLCAAVVRRGSPLPPPRPSNDELKVMSFNIRIDTKADGPNQWSNRRDFAANMIRFYDIDIFGAQEVFANQMTDLQERLPEYGSIGTVWKTVNRKGSTTLFSGKKSASNCWITAFSGLPKTSMQSDNEPGMQPVRAWAPGPSSKTKFRKGSSFS